MDVLETICVSSRGQIVIPERMRANMKIKQGAKMIMMQQGMKIILQTEESFLNDLRSLQEKEGWHSLSFKSLAKVWDNKKDDETWCKY